MFSVLSTRIASEISIVGATVATHDLARKIVTERRAMAAAGSSDAPEELVQLIEHAPPAIEWRVFDHSAAYTRLYVAYERFVFDLIEKWLQLLPELYQRYSELPEVVRTNHRVGVAEILSKLGGDRYANLSEKDVLKGLSDGHWGNTYTLLPDAFTTDEQNLWRETLQKIFNKCGIENIWSWITSHSDIQRFLADVRGDASTAESELRNFIFARNESAHGVVDDIVSLDEIKKLSRFIVILCNVLAEAVHRQFILRKLELGQAMCMGNIIHQFSNQIIGVRVESGSLKTGDELVILQDNSCFTTVVESIEIEHTPYRVVSIWGDTNVGLKVTRPGRVNTQVIKVISSS
jgi:HEPN superfamily RiboL-PSP-like protein